MTGQLSWYVARSSGMVAWALAAGAVIWGLLLSGRQLRDRPGPRWLLDLHRYLGGLAVVFVGVHVFALLVDSYIGFGPTDVLVPFASAWNPVAVAWGVVAMYLLVAVEVTSLLRARLPRRWWRRIHFGSYGLFALATIHALTAGTDASNVVFLGVVIAGVSTVAVLTAARVLEVSRSAPARQPARPSSRRAGSSNSARRRTVSSNAPRRRTASSSTPPRRTRSRNQPAPARSFTSA